MAKSVAIRGSLFMEAGGKTSTGAASNTKICRWGKITITAFTGTGTEPLSAADVGLSTIDIITFHPDLTDSNAPTLAGFPGALWDGTNVIVSEDLATASAAADSSATLGFIVIGDSITPELL